MVGPGDRAMNDQINEERLQRMHHNASVQVAARELLVRSTTI